MKLSQMTNDKASETLIRLSTPIANILEDKNIQPVFKEIADGKGTPIVELVGKTIPQIVSLAMKDHKHDLYEIIGAFAEKRADEVGKIKRFDSKHYKHHDGKRFTKYNELDGKQELDLRDDAAFAYMGHGWRMPTTNDFIRLIDSTIHMWTNNYRRSGVAGTVFTDRTDATKELFFPAVGFCTNGYIHSVGSYGYYWSDSLYPECTVYGCYLYLDSICNVWYNYTNRYFGSPVRGILSSMS